MTKVNSQHTVYCRLAKYFFTNGKYSIEDVQDLVSSNYIDVADYKDITGQDFPEQDTEKDTKAEKVATKSVGAKKSGDKK